MLFIPYISSPLTSSKYSREQKRAELAEKREEIQSNYEKLKSEDYSDSTQNVMTDADLKLLAETDTKLTRKQILQLHCKDWWKLDLKKRRTVYEKIQNQKAMHARNIFLKELNVVGWQFKNKTKNPDPVKAQLEDVE